MIMGKNDITRYGTAISGKQSAAAVEASTAARHGGTAGTDTEGSGGTDTDNGSGGHTWRPSP